MSDGIEITEVPEAPKKDEVQETPEKQAEVKEAAEQAEQTKAAVETPESVVEKRDFQAAENLEEAFKATVPPLEPAAESAPARSTAEGTVSPPEAPQAAQEDLDQGRQTESQSEGGQKAAEEVQSVAAEVSTTAPSLSMEDAGEQGNVTITESTSETPSQKESPRTAENNAEEFLEEAGQPEMQEAVETVPEAESTEQTQSQAMSDLETVERDDSETKLVKDGGDDDKFKPDDGLEQAGDIREDTQISDQYGDDVIETGDGVDTLRDPAQPGEGIDDLPNTIPDLADFTPGEGGGKEPGDLDGPDVGLNQDGDRGKLADAAAFGADSRVGWTGITEMNDSMDSEGEQDITYNETYHNDDGSTTVINTTHTKGKTTQTVTKTTASGETITDTSTQGGEEDGGSDDSSDETSSDDSSSDDSEESKDDAAEKARKAKEKKEKQQQQQKKKQQSTSTTSTKTYDPEGYEKAEFDETTIDGKLRAQAFSNLSSIDQDLDGEAVSQPVDEDGASPKEPGIAFDQATQTDPYSQDTIDGADVPSTGYIPEEKSKFTPGMAGGDDGLLDPDFGVIDPNKPTGEPDDSGDEGHKPTKPN